MRCKYHETSNSGCLGTTNVLQNERSRTVSVNSPLSNLLKSEIKEDSINSDFSMSLSEEDFVYAYSPQTLPEKDNNIVKSDFCSTIASSLAKSQESSSSFKYSHPIVRSRTLSNPSCEFCTHLTCNEQIRVQRPKVLKYIRNFSGSFGKIEILDVPHNKDPNVIYLKAEHELDCQTYILKKRKIFINANEEIKEHTAYKEILDIRTSSIPLNVRYVNSWIELDNNNNEELKNTNDAGVNVILYIQMRYINDLSTLARDLILITNNSQELDEDFVDELSEDTVDQIDNIVTNGVSFKDAVSQEFHKIGFKPDEPPCGIEQEIWRICLNDLMSSS